MSEWDQIKSIAWTPDVEALTRSLSSPDAHPEDEATLIDLIERGVLIAVSVFGSMGDEDWGYGPCDSFTKRNQIGSDCNRAARFLLRPDEGRMTPAVLAAIGLEEHIDEPGCMNPVCSRPATTMLALFGRPIGVTCEPCGRAFQPSPAQRPQENP